MDKRKVDKVQKEMERFQECIADYRLCQEETRERFSQGKYSAALKRSSMDLTRALAELRKPDYS